MTTDEKRIARIKGLLKERRGYVQYGRADRVELVDEELERLDPDGRLAEIDAELKQIGSEGKPPVKRATRRTKKA